MLLACSIYTVSQSDYTPLYFKIHSAEQRREITQSETWNSWSCSWVLCSGFTNLSDPVDLYRSFDKLLQGIQEPPTDPPVTYLERLSGYPFVYCVSVIE